MSERPGESRVAATGSATPRRGCGDPETYARLAREAGLLRNLAPESRLAPLCDLLWEALAPRGLSWVGFYVVEDAAESDPRETTVEGSAETRRGSGLRNSPQNDLEMILVARRDKPACSPIGMHGVCGQGYLEETVRLVEDVALLGPGYIACDPRDRSEIVVPIYRNGRRWGVLDADSHEVGCFGDQDAAGLAAVLSAAGLLDRGLPMPERPLAMRADRLRSAPGTV